MLIQSHGTCNRDKICMIDIVKYFTSYELFVFKYIRNYYHFQFLFIFQIISALLENIEDSVKNKEMKKKVRRKQHAKVKGCFIEEVNKIERECLSKKNFSDDS